jgi:hypothetical protein
MRGCIGMSEHVKGSTQCRMLIKTVLSVGSVLVREHDHFFSAEIDSLSNASIASI